MPTPVDFTGANFGTAWGDLTGDGSQEVVFDEDRLASLTVHWACAPASVNGFGEISDRDDPRQPG